MISIACDQCSKTYKVKPEMAGKKAKCKCGASIQIPAVQKKKKKQPASAAPRRKKPKPKPQNDPWDDDSLADDGFGDDFDDFDQGEDYEDDYDERPRRSRGSQAGGRSRKGGRSKKGKKRKSGSGSSPMKIAGLVFLAIVVLGMLLGLFVKPIGLIAGGGLMVVCSALSFVGSLRCLIAAFQEDVMCGILWFVVPFYSLYYIITRFSELSEYILLWLGGAMGVGFGLGYFAVLQAI